MTKHIEDKTLKILLIVIALLATIWVQAPRLADPYRVDEDLRFFYWVNKFQEKGLFPNDQLLGYTYITLDLPWGELPLYFPSLGYNLLFYAGSFFVPPTLFSKLIPFPLIAITIWYLFEYGKSIGGRKIGLIVALGFTFFNLASGTSLSVVSGLQRGFAIPLIIALLYYLQRRNHVAVAVTVFLSSLFYPPLFLLAAATAGLSFLTRRTESMPSLKIDTRGLIALFVAFCLGVLVLSPVMLPSIQATISPESGIFRDFIYTNESHHVITDAKFGPNGRDPLFDLFPVIGHAGLVEKPLTALHLVILIIIGGLIYLARTPRSRLRLPRELSCLLLASLGLFAAAWIPAFLTGSFFLYLPSRYTRVGLTLFFSFIVLLNVSEAIKDGVVFMRQNPKAMVWLIGGIETLALGFILFYPGTRAVFMGVNMKWLLVGAALLLGALFILSLPRPSRHELSTNRGNKKVRYVFIGFVIVFGLVVWGAYARFVNRQSTLSPSPSERELLTFLETLPKDVLIAGSPCSLDSVTLFSKRQVLFSCEHISMDDQLMLEALDAYYAEKAETIVSFCETYSVDYLVIDSRTYGQEFIDRGWLFFEPQNQALLPVVQSRNSFILAQVPNSSKVFESDNLFVIPCTKTAFH